jgi:LysR family transcriptional regulator, glycine cleavage system transcriptional activator
VTQDGWLPDLDSLRCFLALAERSNFRAAAAEVGLSPAAFSERIRRLEHELGVELFSRTTRTVDITGAGLRLLPRAERLIGAARELRQAVSPGADEPPYALTLGTRFELGLSFIVPALAELRLARPERTIHVQFADGPELLDAVLSKRLDCFIASIRLTHADLAYALLHEEQYVFVAAPALLTRHPLATAEHARDHTLIDTLPDLPLFRYFLDAAPATDSWRFARREYMGSIAAVRHRVLDGAGVAVLPRYFVAEELESGAMVCPQPSIGLASDWFRVVWRADHPRDAQLRALAAEFRARPLR